jgi:hypothetical protein
MVVALEQVRFHAEGRPRQVFPAKKRTTTTAATDRMPRDALHVQLSVFNARKSRVDKTTDLPGEAENDERRRVGKWPTLQQPLLSVYTLRTRTRQIVRLPTV